MKKSIAAATTNSRSIALKLRPARRTPPEALTRGAQGAYQLPGALGRNLWGCVNCFLYYLSSLFVRTRRSTTPLCSRSSRSRGSLATRILQQRDEQADR